MQPVSLKAAFRAAVVCALTILTGCSLFGAGGESSDLTITNNQKCDVDLSQAARAAGIDDTDVIEDISVHPDCTVTIKFRSIAGDSVVEIEERDILYGGQERAPDDGG